MTRPGERSTTARAQVATGLLLTLIVAVPTLVLAEDWHGRPLIDQAGLGWLVPAAVTVLAFAAGGVVAGRRARTAPALARGLAVGALAVAVLLVADGVRRLLMNPTLPMGVVYYWCDGAAVALFCSAAGALAGQRWLPARPAPVVAGAPGGGADAGVRADTGGRRP